MAHWHATLKQAQGTGEVEDTRTADEKEFDALVDDSYLWGHTNMLLAQIANAVNLGTALRGTVSQAPVEDYKPIGPTAITERPEPEKEPNTFSSLSDLKSFLMGAYT